MLSQDQPKPHRPISTENLFQPSAPRPVFTPGTPITTQVAIPGGPMEKADIPRPAQVSMDHFPQIFIDHLWETMRQAKPDQPGALLLLSISNMPMLVSAYGHAMSETVLADLMQAIRAILSPNDAVFRIQRDELAIVSAKATTDESMALARRVSDIVENYGHANPSIHALHVICAMGSVHFPTDAENMVEALDKAYLALASAPYGGFRQYKDIVEDTEKARQQMGLANYLYRAYQEHRLRLAYQPIIESATGKVVHYEALLRIVSPSGQISSAGPLIPVAERMGLIDKIDAMVMEMVVNEVRRSPDLVLAFNVSNLTTDNSIWLETFNRLLNETPEIAPRLTVEITETAAQRDLKRAAYFVAAVQSHGCTVALDDFGSGYTSFRQLKMLSVDMVKIDGVFVKDIAQNADSLFFVKTLLDFARGFGLKAVAEFVENGEIAKKLLELGVDYMQGYYFGKPENHRSWLKGGEYGRD